MGVQTIQPLILIHRRGNFGYNYWGSTSIFWPLPYPFKSLIYYPLNEYIIFSVLKILKDVVWSKSKSWSISNIGVHPSPHTIQGSKGIRQWLIHCCTSPMMINQISPSLGYSNFQYGKKKISKRIIPNFVNQHWGCTSTYCSMSYPLKSLYLPCI